jgi:hypothetical protein
MVMMKVTEVLINDGGSDDHDDAITVMLSRRRCWLSFQQVGNNKFTICGVN